MRKTSVIVAVALVVAALLLAGGPVVWAQKGLIKVGLLVPRPRQVSFPLIVDGLHNGGVAGFVFLPPLAEPAPSGENDNTLTPFVEIFEVDEFATSLRLIATLTPTAASANQFSVLWQTGKFDVQPGQRFRIFVRLPGTLLGFIDVQLAEHGRATSASGFDIALVDGQAVPINFRIEPGGLCLNVVCTALDQCHDVGVCDPATGVCSNPPKADGATCDDGNACRENGTCQAGACVGGTPKPDGTLCSPACDLNQSLCSAGTCVPVTCRDGWIARDSLAADPPTNPSDEWTYGFATAPGEDVQRYDTFTLPGSVIDWHLLGTTLPRLLFATFDSILGNVAVQADRAILQPDSGKFSVLLWTAPEPGTFRVFGSFDGSYSSSGTFSPPLTSDARVVVIANGNTLLDGALSQANDYHLVVDQTLTLPKDATVQYLVGPGSGADATALTAIIVRPQLPPGCDITGPPTCEDFNDCTTNICQEATGCTHEPVLDGTSCFDPNFNPGTCQAGACVPTRSP